MPEVDAQWLVRRLPFVVWDADVTWPCWGRGTGFEPDSDTVTRADIRREDDGRRVAVITMLSGKPDDHHAAATTELAHLLDEHHEGHIGHWLERYADRLPPLDDPKWKPALIEFDGRAVTGKRITWDAFTFAVAEYSGGHVVIGCNGTDLPRLIPATIGTIVSAIPTHEPEQRSIARGGRPPLRLTEQLRRA